MIAILVTCRRCSSETVKKNRSVNGRAKYQCNTCQYQGYFDSKVGERAAKYALVEQLLLERNPSAALSALRE
jgi:transposase-like protein